ncbi:MAG: phage portal protein [Chloroflexota bacterium]|nr:phage portal protein [Chloroflexota bacterium]
MGALANVMRAATKAFTFPGYGTSGAWSGYGMRPWYGGIPGERDWSRIVGDGSSSSIVSACCLWIARNFAEAPPVVVDASDGIPQIVRGHALPKMLRRPNPYYSGTLMWYGVLADFIVTGDAYIYKARDDNGKVGELWYTPSRYLTPRRRADAPPGELVSYYEYRPHGEVIEVPQADIYHLRYGVDPNNVMRGLSPLHTLLRELGVDSEASRFTASLLHNLGVPGLVIAPDKESKGSLDEDAREAVKAKFKQSFSGDNRGDPIVLSRPTDVSQWGFNPQEMDLGALRDIPEERVTAVLGMPAAVVGFGTGLQTAKVGATMSELRFQAMENCQIPTYKLIADELTVQMLPDFANPAELEYLEVAFDLSQVRALMDSNLKLAELQSTLARSGIKKRGETRATLGLPVSPEDDVYIPSPGVQMLMPDTTAADVQAMSQPALAPLDQLAIPANVPKSALTSREHDVALRVSKGMTNQAISEDLVLSVRTVDKHVGNILAKLGLKSRTEITAPDTEVTVGAVDDGMEAKFGDLLRELVAGRNEPQVAQVLAAMEQAAAGRDAALVKGLLALAEGIAQRPVQITATLEGKAMEKVVERDKDGITRVIERPLAAERN